MCVFFGFRRVLSKEKKKWPLWQTRHVATNGLKWHFQLKIICISRFLQHIKSVPEGQKSQNSHFFLRKKKSPKIIRFKSLKKKIPDPRPKKCPKNYFPNPWFLSYVGFQWLLRKYVLKIGHYLETRFSAFWEGQLCGKKKSKCATTIFLILSHMKHTYHS